MSEIDQTTSKSPRTEAQREASRRNGALSRGPSTPMGKANSSRNSLTHGLTSKTLVLENENPEEFDIIFTHYRDIFQPANHFELDCVPENGLRLMAGTPHLDRRNRHAQYGNERQRRGHSRRIPGLR